MKKITVVCLLIILISCTSNKTSSGLFDSRENVPDDVWICLGTSSHAFHASYECKGMKSCRGKKKRVSLEEAYSMERTPCHFCCDENLYQDPHDPDIYDPMNDNDD